jgi:hypothetical protein
MGFTMHIALTDKMKNTVTSLAGKYEEEEVLLDDPYVDEMIILKWTLTDMEWDCSDWNHQTHYRVQ